MKPRRLVGYWRNNVHSDLPDPSTFVDATWDGDERDTVSAFLLSGTTAAAFMGFSQCRICEVDNGALEFTDGVYQWPEGLAHYVDEHHVRLPPEFVTHAVRAMEDIDAAQVSLDWWVTITRG